MQRHTSRRGFTIIELLVVIVVIAILAAITFVAYGGVQDRAKNTQAKADITQLQKRVDLYAVQNGGRYPSTGGLSVVYVDGNCTLTTVNKRADWIPGLDGEALPQNPGLIGSGVGRSGGCYMYASDGVSYIISAWNAKRGGPNSDEPYRRVGFREPGFASSNNYLCNHTNIGGMATGSYIQTSDFYKYSYTASNITSCNEAPPAGA